MKKRLTALLMALMLVVLAACGSSSATETGVTIVNDLGYGWTELMVSPESDNYWGDSIADEGTDEATVMLSDYEAEDDEAFDLYMVDVDGDYYEFYGLELSDGDVVTLSWGGDGDPIATITPTKGDETTVTGTITLEGSGSSESNDYTEDTADVVYALDLFMGCWKYDNYDYYIVMYEDGKWAYLDSDGDIIVNEDYGYDGEYVYLYDEDGSVYYTVTFENGSLIDNEGDTLSPSNWPGN